MLASSHSDAAATISDTIISKVELAPAAAKTPGRASITVTLATPAPAEGLAVQLSSSNPALVTVPASLNIAAGQNAATIQVQIGAIRTASTAEIVASSGNSRAGTTFTLISNTTAAPFTITVAPATLTVLQGKSGLSKVITKASGGYSHSLQLKTSGAPVGVSATAKPAIIAAPGSGTSQLTAAVNSDAETGVYPMTVTATDGTNSAEAKLNLNVISGTANPDATFQGCWYKSGGHRYQAVDLKVGKPGTYPFNAVLYSGTSCNAKDYADQFGFGQEVALGSSNYTMWFTAFADQTSMSAIWYLGDENSKCVDYSTAPSC